MQTDSSDTPPPPDQPPSDFQRRVLWIAVTAVAMLAIGAVAVYFIHVITEVLQFLQPVLVPIAFAGILAYLLEPIIKKLTDRGTPRFRAMMLVWCGFHLVLLLLFLSVAVPTFISIRQYEGSITGKLTSFVSTALDGVDKVIGRIRGEEEVKKPEGEAAAAVVTPPEAHTVKAHETVAKIAAKYQVKVTDLESKNIGMKVEPGVILRLPANAKAPGSDGAPSRESWVRTKVNAWVADNGEELTAKITGGLSRSFQGILGLFGYLVGFLLVPVYLYYFLKESASIQKGWSDYIPLRTSRFRAELVCCLTEINGYLIAFFRGQMLVSMIDGLLVGICLAIIGLPYAMLIGVFVAMLGLIPYVGNVLCLLAACCVSVAHFGATEKGQLVNTLWGIDQVWVYPLIVIGIFTVVQQINSLVTAPRIVGDAVGLHPLTVIFSVLFWSLLIGGLLGALLAVPLTASVKVILRRYVWERRVQPQLAPPQGYPVT